MTYNAKPGSTGPTKAVRLCAHPGCKRYTMHRLCAEHRIPTPTGDWLIASQLRDEFADTTEGKKDEQ